MASKKKKTDPAVEDNPVLEIEDALFSAPADPVPLVAGAAVHMKLPTFWPDAAEVWFAQADAQFAIRNVSSSKTKFYHAVAVLPQDVASQILDLIRAPPTSEPYEVLRERLIKLYTLNDYQRFEALVSLPLSGDQKPSHLMNRMLALLPDDYKPDFILRGLFLRRLPIDVRSHLPREKVDDLRALALKADELYQSRVSPSAVNLLSDDFGDSVNLVSARAKVPSRPVTPKLSPSVKNPPSRRSQTRPRSPTPAPSSRSPDLSGFCWFHKKHGVKASNCRAPCSFSGNE